MSLPLGPRVSGSRTGRRRAASVLLGLLLLVGSAGLGRAQQAEDPYTATVKVDATADSAANAREAARVDGQRRALAAIADRLSGGTGAAKLAKLDDKAITDLVVSFEVANERMSAVRYLADYTFHFRPADVRRALRNAGIALGEGESGNKPLVLLPVYQADGQSRLWDDPNPWREAWGQRPSGSGALRLLVPLGDVGDIAIIDGD